MSVKAALYDYLTDRRDLPGLPARPFERPRLVGGQSIAHRNDARRWLRDKIGDAVYLQRRPRDVGHTAITLRTASESTEYGLDGAVEGSFEAVSVTVYARGGDAGLRAETVASLLKLAVDGYHGDTWGGVEIGEATLDNKSTRETAPVDASDNWEYEVALDLTVLYVDESNPVYPVDRLTAYVHFVDAANQGAALRLSIDESIIPAGRSVASVTWIVRTSIGGPAVVTITGHPDAAAGVANVTGTKGSPAIDRTAYGLSATDVFVSLTLTDDSGTVSTAEGYQNGS